MRRVACFLFNSKERRLLLWSSEYALSLSSHRTIVIRSSITGIIMLTSVRCFILVMADLFSILLVDMYFSYNAISAVDFLSQTSLTTSKIGRMVMIYVQRSVGSNVTLELFGLIND